MIRSIFSGMMKMGTVLVNVSVMMDILTLLLSLLTSANVATNRAKLVATVAPTSTQNIA